MLGRFRFLWLVSAAVASCGSPLPRAAHAHANPAPADPDEQRAVADLRDLGPDATFADLVAVAARQDQLRDSDSDAGCILRSAGTSFRFEADLAVAVRPLPEVPDDLDARLERTPGPVRVLTRYGSYGDSGQLGASALTTTAPPGESIAALVVLTDQGIYVRHTDRAVTALGPRSPTFLRASLVGSTTVFVTCEGTVPLIELRDLLALLPPGLEGHIALAVLLSDDTRLPDAVMLAPSDAEPLCAGLPDLAPDATLGDLPSDRVVQALTPLRAAGEICVGTNTGTGARGGHVVIDVRVASGGAVSDACVREDETGDATLRACLVRATRALTFDDPGGAFDFELPLVLAPGISHRQRALCD